MSHFDKDEGRHGSFSGEEPIGQSGDANTPGQSTSLNGTVGDLKLIEDLMAKDRVNDALEIIDRILEIPQGSEKAINHLRAIMSNQERIILETIVETNRLIIRNKIGPGYVSVLLESRGVCFSAILDTPNPGKSNFMSRALEHVDIVLCIFPNSINHMILSAQILFLSGSVNRANDLLQKVLSIDPNNKEAKACQSIFIEGGNTGMNYVEMTEQAIKMIDSILSNARANPVEAGSNFGKVDTKAINETIELLLKSLDLWDKQPRALAALALIGFSMGHTEDAKGFLKKAQSLDPSDDYVQYVIRCVIA